MRDPYLWEDVPVLKNLLGIKDRAELERAEADITYTALLDIDITAPRTFDYPYLLAVHKHIFCDIYDWAGKIRTIPIVKGERVLGGDTVRYSHPDNIENDCKTVIKKLNTVNWADLSIRETADTFARLIAELWQVHPFREGNTRATITFATQFAEAHGFKMDKLFLRDSAAYVRDALVKASDGEYSEYGFLIRIFEDAIRRG